MQCTKCGCDIPAGAACLSQLPWDLPVGIQRSDYLNFCIACCEWDLGGPPVPWCRLSRDQLQGERAVAPVSCHCCQATVPQNDRLFCWTFFDWPKLSGSRSARGGTEPTQEGGTNPWVGALHRRKGGWNSLSPDTQRRFQTRGLGRGLAPRSLTKARKFFEGSIPKSIRDGGDKSVRRFMRGRDVSHIESVARNPGRAKASGNVVWEKSSRNRSRGARNMTKGEVAAAKAATRRSGYAELGRSVAKQAAWAAALEFVVAGLENWFHWKRGRKTAKQAAKDTAKSTVTSLWIAAVWLILIKVIGLIVPSLVLLVLYLAMGSLIVGLFMGAPLTIPLVILGALLIVLTVLAMLAASKFVFLIVGAVKTYRRVAQAASQDDEDSDFANDGFPLDEFRVYFCSRCILQEHIRPRVGPDSLEWSTGLSPESGR